MAWPAWFSEHWFSALQTISIVGSLLFAGVSMRADAKARRVQNLLTLTGAHRDLWLEFAKNPKFARIVNPDADLTSDPMTHEERVFLTAIVLHLSSAHRAIREGMLSAPQGLAADIRTFFGRPMPAAAWSQLRPMLDRDFVRFVEDQLR